MLHYCLAKVCVQSKYMQSSTALSSPAQPACSTVMIAVFLLCPQLRSSCDKQSVEELQSLATDFLLSMLQPDTVAFSMSGDQQIHANQQIAAYFCRCRSDEVEVHHVSAAYSCNPMGCSSSLCRTNYFCTHIQIIHHIASPAPICPRICNT